MTIQKIHIEGPAVNLVFCPVCGAKWDLGVSEKIPCKHIIFAYLDLVGDFIAVATRLKPLVEKAMDSDEDSPVEALLNLLDSKSQFCIEFNDSESPAMAMAGSLYVGIDFFPSKTNRKNSNTKVKIGHK